MQERENFNEKWLCTRCANKPKRSGLFRVCGLNCYILSRLLYRGLHYAHCFFSSKRSTTIKYLFYLLAFFLILATYVLSSSFSLALHSSSLLTTYCDETRCLKSLSVVHLQHSEKKMLSLFNNSTMLVCFIQTYTHDLCFNFISCSGLCS